MNVEDKEIDDIVDHQQESLDDKITEKTEISDDVKNRLRSAFDSAPATKENVQAFGGNLKAGKGFWGYKGLHEKIISYIGDISSLTSLKVKSLKEANQYRWRIVLHIAKDGSPHLIRGVADNYYIFYRDWNDNEHIKMKIDNNTQNCYFGRKTLGIYVCDTYTPYNFKITEKTLTEELANRIIDIDRTVHRTIQDFVSKAILKADDKQINLLKIAVTIAFGGGAGIGFAVSMIVMIILMMVLGFR